MKKWMQFKTIKRHTKHLKTALIILSILIVSLVISKITPSIKIDPYANHDFDYVLNAASINKTAYIENLTLALAQDNSFFAKGDAYLILGRLTKNPALLCASTDFYSMAEDVSQRFFKKPQFLRNRNKFSQVLYLEKVSLKSEIRISNIETNPNIKYFNDKNKENAGTKDKALFLEHLNFCH